MIWTSAISNELESAAALDETIQSYWRVQKGELQLVWTNGLSGLLVTLKGDPSRLAGSVTPITDAANVRLVSAAVTAERIDCSGRRSPAGR